MKIDDYKGNIHTLYQPKDGIRIKKLHASFPESCIYHITNPTLEFFVDKINRYTTDEARVHYSSKRKFSKTRVLLSGLKEFWLHYIVRRGYRDGWRGFWLSLVFVFYKFLVFGKTWEMGLHNGNYPSTRDARDSMRSFITTALKK
jgi:hypothetical protein